ncbi:MAG: oxidoreductase [Jatrophihabitans sp.]|uniref:oxidoreductase n=1 Tax=Jatrophihabitans sp. TaxID=1932789 RepID=UPI003F7EB00E
MEDLVGWTLRRRSRAGTLRTATGSDVDHLTEFAGTRRGVEAFLEPRTTVTETTVVLVADTGEWTRRRVADPDAAAKWARKHGVPLYDAVKVGYPRRMREWSRNNPRPSGPTGEQSEADGS